MKRVVSLLLVVLMLLCLCACGNTHTQNPDPATTTAPATTTTVPTSTTTGSTQVSAENSTTATTTESTATTVVAHKTQPAVTTPNDVPPVEPPQITAPNSPQITAPTSPHITTPKPTTPTKVTQTTVAVTTTTTAHSTCDHSYTTASCTVPKICTKCQHIAGHTLPHNYQNGVCTVCGRAEFVSFNSGDWVAYVVRPGTAEQGEVLSIFIMKLNVRPMYEEDICYLNPDACIVNIGKVVYREKTYCVDFYPSCHLGATWEENGDTVTAVLSDTQLTLTKTGEGQLTVTASNDTVRVPLGTVFNKM